MKNSHESPKSYVVGYILSLVLTVAAFAIVLTDAMSLVPMLVSLLVLAVLQIVVQLFFFMHLNEKEQGPAWHKMALGVGLLITLSIIVGSVWVMAFSNQPF